MYKLVKAVKALSDDTRMRIINILIVRECCVCEVMKALNISQTRASRNLTILHDAGFLTMRKEGLWSIYSLDEKDMPDYMHEFCRAVKLALVNNNVGMQDCERLKSTVRSGICFQRDNAVSSAETPVRPLISG